METNNLREMTGMGGTEYHAQFKEEVDWTDPHLDQITRLRLISDPGFPAWDISYCHGVLIDGTLVNVRLPFHQLPKRGRGHYIVKEARKAGVHAKRLGIFDAISTLV